MSVASSSSCRDFQKRFDLFLDGEMDGRAMRSLALHVTRCRECEEELRQCERLQEGVAEAVQSRVDGIDVSSLWLSIEPQIAAPRRSLRARFADRWNFRSGASAQTIALAAALGMAVVFLTLFWGAPAGPQASHVANNKAQIDSLSSSAQAVGVWTEPRQNTTAIWVASYEP